METIPRASVALAELEGTFDAAMKRAPNVRTRNALVALREKVTAAMKRAAKGVGGRIAADVFGETLESIQAILHPDAKQTIAKRAGKAVQLERDGMIPEGAMKTDALTAIGKEFMDLAAKAEKTCRKLGAEFAFGQWREKFRRNLIELLRVGDLQGAQAEMRKARAALSALLDEARRKSAFGH
jgi:hypothetical protein